MYGPAGSVNVGPGPGDGGGDVCATAGDTGVGAEGGGTATFTWRPHFGHAWMPVVSVWKMEEQSGQRASMGRAPYVPPPSACIPARRCGTPANAMNLSRLVAAALMLSAAPVLAGSNATNKLTPAKPAEAAPSGEVLLRGEKLQGLPAVSLEALLKDPTPWDGKEVALSATVRRACQKKGCWMELAPSMDSKSAGVRVKFKDYGFFVPLDSAGSTAKVEGVVKVAELSESAAKHYESEGASVPRGADGKAREVQFMASGVELTRAK